jgi:gamma-glutamyl hydrolase
MRVLLLLAAIIVAAHALNTRPIIGILTLPCYDPDCQSSQSFPASYSKYLEAAGARVVPLPYNWSSAQMDSMLGQINGVLFTGGGAELDNASPFFQQVQHIFGKVVAFNQAGTHFPLWGTCLGFEALVRACSNDPHILFDNYDSWNYSVPIVPTSLASQSRMFMSPFGGEVLKAISTNAYPFHNHHSGVRPDSFAANPKLSSFFNALATNVDRSGNPFVSLIEGKSMPIYGSQVRTFASLSSLCASVLMFSIKFQFPVSPGEELVRVEHVRDHRSLARRCALHAVFGQLFRARGAPERPLVQQRAG